MPARPSALRTRSFRLDAKLLAEARRATGAGDDTEVVRIALAELVERARFKRWILKVAGKGRLRGLDA
jgi:Arc/MetJ family transcription regulator